MAKSKVKQQTLLEPTRYRMVFGKYRGWTLSNVPPHYFLWIHNDNGFKHPSMVALKAWVKFHLADIHEQIFINEQKQQR